MLGSYRYHCPQHGTSDPYAFRRKADEFGRQHRDEYHAGMHPPGGDGILSQPFDIRDSGVRSALIAFLVVMLLAFGSRLL